MKRKILKIILCMVILAIIFSIVVLVFINERDKTISLINEYKQIEYGEIYNPTIEELIDLEKFNFIDVSKMNIEFNIEKENDKDYAKVGDYTVKVFYKNITLIQNIKVIDTIAPTISIDEKIEIDQNTDLTGYDFKSLVKFSDLSETKEIKIDYSNVDSTKPGEYTAKVLVEDIFGNASEKEFKIVILEVVQPIEENINTEKEKIKTSTTTSNTKATTIPSNSNNKTTSNINKPSSNVNIATNNISSGNSNSNKENTNTTPSANTNNSSNSSTLTKKDDSNYCINGGPEHVEGDGKNEHGYYASWDLAWEACQEYMKGKGTVSFKVGECWCGLFYFWVE